MPKGELKGVLDADRTSPANCAALVRVLVVGLLGCAKGTDRQVLQRSQYGRGGAPRVPSSVCDDRCFPSFTAWESGLFASISGEGLLVVVAKW